MNITEDIQPLAEFKRDTVNFISHLKETGRPAILTVNGRPAVVVMDAAAWQEDQDHVEYARSVAAIGKGLAQARAGQGVEASEFFDKLGVDGQ